MSSEFRWRAVANYRAENGPIDVEWFFEELEELHDFVESGPDWNALIDIRITLMRVTDPELTVEASEEL